MWNKWIREDRNNCPMWRLFALPKKDIVELARVEVCPDAGRRAYLLARDEKSVVKRKNGFVSALEAREWCEAELGVGNKEGDHECR